MFQNIKVDIIYYKTATDFEMEFNLSGCCRMRLLTDKAPDRKILVNQLVRAVSRSRIIMISGALFGEEGVIETCAKAIGKSLTVIDNGKYGIETNDSISVIENSIPLVCSDGIFGGCIIEQGPQTLILLSENKSIRKNIMQNLIHPYVKEICAEELVEKSAENTDITEEEKEDAMPILEETEPEEESAEELIAEEETEKQPPNQLIEDDEEDEDLPDIVEMEDEFSKEDFEGDSDIVIDEPKKKFGWFKREQDDFSYMDEEAQTYVTDEYDAEDEVRKGRGINIAIIIISVMLLAVVGILLYCIFAVPASMGISAGEYIKETFNTLFG